MNRKILDILEYDRILDKLADFSITQTAKIKAKNLKPETNYNTVQKAIKQTLSLVNILRLKGRLPLTDFIDVKESVKRLKIKAELNAQELGNILLVLVLAQDVNNFIQDIDDLEVDLEPISDLLNSLDVPTDLLTELQQALEFDGTILDGASSKLRSLRREIAANESLIKEKMDSYVKGNNGKYLSEQIVTIRDERYVIPVKQEYRAKFGGVVHDQSASGQTLFVEPEAIVNLNNHQQNLIAQEKQEIRRILKHLSNMARDHASEIQNIAKTLTELDFLQAKARLAQKMKASEPLLTKDHVVDMLNARHPLIDPEKVVPNNIRLGSDYDTMLITGPNTGGKTITLKTIGLLQVMAQSGLFIPASEGSKVGVFKEVFADIGDEQSIEQSLSTFSSHMIDIISIMKHANEDSLILIDEIGAGTDPEEGASLAISILDDLRKKNAKIMVTTHYPELKLYGYNRPRTTNASMEFNVQTLSPTYRLQIGIPGHSNAFAIAKRLGMPQDIVDDARALMNDEDSDINQMIDKLNAQTKAATAARTKLEKQVEEGSALVKQLQDALDIYHQRVNKQLELAEERANEVVAKKRKKADEIIASLEEQRKAGVLVKENKLIDARGQFNKLEKQERNLAHNKVLQREKRKHNVKVGDQVKVLNYGQVGTITKQLSDHEFEVQMGIIKVKAASQDLEKMDKVASKPKVVQATSSRGLRTNSARSELDLRGQRYDEAMTNLDRYIDNALLSGLSTVTIIHGIGTGAIRSGVWKYLKTNRHVKSFNYAPANEGGNGATIVQLK